MCPGRKHDLLSQRRYLNVFHFIVSRKQKYFEFFMVRGAQTGSRNPNSRRNRAASFARHQLLQRVQSRSQALLRSKLQNKARVLSREELRALTNPRRKPNSVDGNYKTQQGIVAENALKLVEEYLLEKLKQHHNDPSMNDAQSKLLLKNGQASRRMTHEFVHGMPLDVDGNTIHFKSGSGQPYIVVSDFEELRNYVVLVDVYEVTVSNSRGSLPCTFENPEGAEIVLATEPAAAIMSPGSSIFIPIEQFLRR